MPYYSQVLYTAPGTQDTFSVPFGYLSKSHVKVQVNGIDAQHTWLNDSSVRIFPTPGDGAIVRIKRETPRDDRLVNYQNASTLSQQDLNKATTQNFYLAQEAYDLYYYALYPALVTLAEEGGVANPTNETVIDQLIEEVLASQLYADLQTQIDLIEINSEATLQTILRDDAAINTLRLHQRDISGNAAAIVTEQIARADGDSALASSITTLQTTVDGNTASIQTNVSSINGLEAQYTVKIDNNGYVSGFGLASYPADEGTFKSSFIILADEFAVVTPGDTPVVPFIVGNVGGAPQVGINGQLLVDGTIYADAVAANAIGANHIQVTNLSSIKSDLGDITAGSITIDGAGGYFNLSNTGALTVRNSASGQRLVITANRIDVYDSSNNLRVRIGEL